MDEELFSTLLVKPFKSLDSMKITSMENVQTSYTFFSCIKSSPHSKDVPGHEPSLFPSYSISKKEFLLERRLLLN